MSDLVPVSREVFFSYVMPRDIVLRTEPDYTIWETRGRAVVGMSTPGWRSPHGTPKTWKLDRNCRDSVIESR